jgi:hypothetical protein
VSKFVGVAEILRLRDTAMDRLRSIDLIIEITNHALTHYELCTVMSSQ